MSRLELVGTAVALALGLASASDVQAAREAKREFPHSTRCPVHTPGPSPLDDPLVFTSAHGRARLTFLTCDDASSLSAGTPAGHAVNVSIDDLRVVARSVFDEPTNRLAFPVAGYDANCYFGFPVESVFNPAAALPGSPAMPYFNDFSGSSNTWTLANAVFGRESGDATNRSLILARAVRGTPPNTRPGDLCSVASVLVGGLTPGAEYVIDFSWWVGGTFSAGDPVLDVVVDDDPAPPSGPWITNGRRSRLSARARAR